MVPGQKTFAGQNARHNHRGERATERHHRLPPRQQRSAAFLTGILGLPAAARFAHFHVVEADNGVSLDSPRPPGTIAPQHYAFLVGEEDFDAAFGRIRTRTCRTGQILARACVVINHRDGGRGLYFEDPDGHLLEIITRPYGSGS